MNRRTIPGAVVQDALAGTLTCWGCGADITPSTRTDYAYDKATREHFKVCPHLDPYPQHRVVSPPVDAKGA